MVAERISESIREQTVDVLLPQMVEQLLEVPKINPQDRILQQTAKQIADRSEAKRADLAKVEKSLAALMESQAADKSSCTQVASDHEASVKVFAEELKGVGRGNTGAPIRNGWSRRTDVLTVPGKYKCCFTDIDRSQRIRYDVSGQTARRAGAFCCACSAGIAHLCNHEVWCRR